MSKIVVFIMGPSGCGKSTLEKAITKWQSYYKVVSVTTRDKRINEVDGVDYHFISDIEYNRLESAGELIQTTSFAGNRYGTTRSEYTTEHVFATLVAVPESVARFTPVIRENFPDYKIVNIFFDISNDKLRENMKARGDTDKEIEVRLSHDNLRQQMQDSGLVADITINDHELNDMLCYKVGHWLEDEIEKLTSSFV